ncbi:hypothetical protein WJX72_010200 [[Myrmecia] bisecta]|uniref:Uncharacterized protein n=1 Tax=[Myrmecia] bisecta TaxID=41462 RepID=A0AAW1QG55_9CHLO
MLRASRGPEVPHPRLSSFEGEAASVQNKEACHERLCREKDGVALCDYPGPSSRQLEFDAPLGLQLTGGPSGAPDLRLNLISLRAGADVQAAWTCKRRRSSLARKAPLLADAAGFAGRAAGLLFLQLIFPDSLPPHLKYLALAGSVSAATRLVGLARSRRRGSTVSRLKQHGHAAAADLRRAAPWLVDGTASTARWLDAYGIPAFALMLGATLWSWFNPVSYHDTYPPHIDLLSLGILLCHLSQLRCNRQA